MSLKTINNKLAIQWHHKDRDITVHSTTILPIVRYLDWCSKSELSKKLAQHYRVFQNELDVQERGEIPTEPDLQLHTDVLKWLQKGIKVDAESKRLFILLMDEIGTPMQLLDKGPAPQPEQFAGEPIAETANEAEYRNSIRKAIEDEGGDDSGKEARDEEGFMMAMRKVIDRK